MVLRAAPGWTAAETARRFAVTEQTVANWMRVVHEGGGRGCSASSRP
ncbi:MAG: hypothetical protein KC560_06835 [Myxococcales bacterium]|nr:hypothetical protein [Myxococcales bacterium]